MKNLQLSLNFAQLNAQDTHFLVLRQHRIFAALQQLLLDIGFLPQDTELVIPVDELNPSEIPSLHRLLIRSLQHDHFPLDRVDDEVELIDLDDNCETCSFSACALLYIRV